jgi:hypothetical protein
LPLPCAYEKTHDKELAFVVRTTKTHGKPATFSVRRAKKRTAKVLCQLPYMATLPCVGNTTHGKGTYVFLFLFSLLKFPIQPKITGVIYIS